MHHRRQKWWNSLGFETSFKRRLIARVVGFALAYVLISTICMGAIYGSVIGPLSRGEMPLALRLEILGDTGGIPGLSEISFIWAALMTSMSVFFALVVGLYLSHQLAGPLYRFKRELGRVARREPLQIVQLRDGDEDFTDFAAVLNRALERIQADEALHAQQLEASEATRKALCEGVLRHLDDPDALRRLVDKSSPSGA